MMNTAREHVPGPFRFRFSRRLRVRGSSRTTAEASGLRAALKRPAFPLHIRIKKTVLSPFDTAQKILRHGFAVNHAVAGMDKVP